MRTKFIVTIRKISLSNEYVLYSKSYDEPILQMLGRATEWENNLMTEGLVEGLRKWHGYWRVKFFLH